MIFNDKWENILPKLADKSIGLVLTDPPYKKTQQKWDTDVDWAKLWPELNRVCVDDAAIVIFGSQPFTSIVVCSNLKNFKHEWIWQKDKGANFAQVKRSPMKEHENIVVFSTGRAMPKYYPIKEQRKGNGLNLIGNDYMSNTKSREEDMNCGRMTSVKGVTTELRYPSSIQKFNRESGFHCVQKPLKLLSYLIKTYSNPGDLVLDCFMGSGSTNIAAMELGRRSIGIEKDENIFKIAQTRINTYGTA